MKKRMKKNNKRLEAYWDAYFLDCMPMTFDMALVYGFSVEVKVDDSPGGKFVRFHFTNEETHAMLDYSISDDMAKTAVSIDSLVVKWLGEELEHAGFWR